MESNGLPRARDQADKINAASAEQCNLRPYAALSSISMRGIKMLILYL